MIRNIILDMGNVCCRWDIYYLAQCLTDHIDDQKLIIEHVFKSPQWQLLDAGAITLQQAEHELLETVDENKKMIIKKALYHWHDYFDQYDEMEAYIIALKERGYKVYLLSNCSMQFYDYYQKKSIFSHFDDYYISAKYHLTKPRKEIYLDFLKRFDLKAEECIFIDDVKDNIDGARSVGMKGFVYDGNIDELDNILKKDKIHQ